MYNFLVLIVQLPLLTQHAQQEETEQQSNNEK